MKMEVFQRPWLSNGPAKAKPFVPYAANHISHLDDRLPAGDNLTGSNHEYEYRDRLRTWLVKMIESAAVPGLKWLNEEKNIFRMPWKHAGRQDYNLEDSKIFMEWAKHSGRYREGIDKPEPIVWKTRLRCALNKMPDIRELPEMSRLDISDPYRVYELLPPMHKGNDDKIRRRVYKRSNGSHEEIEGPISPKVMRTNELHPAYTNPTYATNTLPATGRQSLNTGAGSTGSQSGSQDDDLSDPDNQSPPTSNASLPSEHPSPWIRHTPNYPIPQNPHGMTPSSMALSLINCNPIVANDPILNSSLTSLATQILHMEHLIQVYMNQTRTAQSEAGKVEEKLREANKRAAQAKDENLSLQQCLVTKLLNESPVNLEQHVSELEQNLAVFKSVSKIRSDPKPISKSKLLDLLPHEKKLEVLSKHLNSSQSEVQNLQIERSKMLVENQKLQYQLEQMQRLTTIGKLDLERKPFISPLAAISMESPPSSRNSDSSPESEEDKDEEEIEVIEC